MAGETVATDIEDLFLTVFDDLAPSSWGEVGQPGIPDDGMNLPAEIAFPLNHVENGVHMNPSCDGKVKYGTWARASKDASYSKIRWGDVLHPYRCKLCGAYHIGSRLKEDFGHDSESRRVRSDGARSRSWS